MSSAREIDLVGRVAHAEPHINVYRVRVLSTLPCARCVSLWFACVRRRDDPMVTGVGLVGDQAAARKYLTGRIRTTTSRDVDARKMVGPIRARSSRREESPIRVLSDSVDFVDSRHSTARAIPNRNNNPEFFQHATERQFRVETKNNRPATTPHNPEGECISEKRFGGKDR